MNATDPSLFDRLGGESAIDAIVKALYERVLADDDLRPFFEKTPMDKQRIMQHEFLCAALGGPMSYTGKPIAHAHQGLGITAQHLAKFVRHLLDALRELGVSEGDADQVITRINVFSNEITGKSY